MGYKINYTRKRRLGGIWIGILVCVMFLFGYFCGDGDGIQAVIAFCQELLDGT